MSRYASTRSMRSSPSILSPVSAKSRKRNSKHKRVRFLDLYDQPSHDTYMNSLGGDEDSNFGTLNGWDMNIQSSPPAKNKSRKGRHHKTKLSKPSKQFAKPLSPPPRKQKKRPTRSEHRGEKEDMDDNNVQDVEQIQDQFNNTSSISTKPTDSSESSDSLQSPLPKTTATKQANPFRERHKAGFVSHSKLRQYGLFNTKGEPIALYSAFNPKQAALDAARDGHENIILREHNRQVYDDQVHVYEGSRRPMTKDELEARNQMEEYFDIRHKPQVKVDGAMRVDHKKAKLVHGMPPDEAEWEDKCYEIKDRDECGKYPQCEWFKTKTGDETCTLSLNFESAYNMDGTLKGENQFKQHDFPDMGLEARYRREKFNDIAFPL